MILSHAERSRKLQVSSDGRCTKTAVADEKVPYFYISPIPFPTDLDGHLVWYMHGVSVIPTAGEACTPAPKTPGSKTRASKMYDQRKSMIRRNV